MKRLIVRQQVIDCGAETCGKCKMRNCDFCEYWDEWLTSMEHRGRVLRQRCYHCKNAEVRDKCEASTHR